MDMKNKTCLQKKEGEGVMNDDFIGGQNYNQTEDQLKAKKWMKWIGIILILLLVISIVLIGVMYYIQSTQLKITVDGKSNSNLENVLIFENGEVYIPIRAFAEYVGYESYSGDYKQYAEDTTKCYVQSANEVASFSLNSNKIYKIVLDGNNDYEYYEIDEPVRMMNNQLCTTIEGARIAFNISMAYDQEDNRVTIFTLPYLVTYYTAQFQNSGIADKEAIFSNQKALLYNMIVVKNAEGNYGVYGLDGKEVLGTKYKSVKFIESTKEFIVTTLENKMGIMSYDSTTKINPEYDDIKQIDKNSGLYLVTNNKKQGVINENGSIILYLEFDQIGIDGTKYNSNNIKNQYLLYDNCIPVKRNNKWGVFDKTGKQILEVKYDELGCTAGSGTAGDKTANNILLIPDYEGIVVKQGELYGIMDSSGKELVPIALQSVYSITSAGQDTYYMIYDNRVMNVITYIETYVVKDTNAGEETQNTIDGNSVNNTNTVNGGNTVNNNTVNGDNTVSQNTILNEQTTNGITTVQNTVGNGTNGQTQQNQSNNQNSGQSSSNTVQSNQGNGQNATTPNSNN